MLYTTYDTYLGDKEHGTKVLAANVVVVNQNTTLNISNNDYIFKWNRKSAQAAENEISIVGFLNRSGEVKTVNVEAGDKILRGTAADTTKPINLLFWNPVLGNYLMVQPGTFVADFNNWTTRTVVKGVIELPDA